MTVAELIAKLQAFPQDARVVTAGFDEAHIDDIEHVELIKVRFTDNPIGHCGRHTEDENGELAVYIDF